MRWMEQWVYPGLTNKQIYPIACIGSIPLRHALIFESSFSPNDSDWYLESSFLTPLGVLHDEWSVAGINEYRSVHSGKTLVPASN